MFREMIQTIFVVLLMTSQIAWAKGQAKDIGALYSEIASMAVSERLLKSTRYFLDTPTGLNPLGEGRGLDPKPIFSLEKFDCTTYVETSLALAFAKSENEVGALLNKIRYQGDTVDYFERNHFMVSDWIPANSKKGFVHEITDKMAQEKSAFRPDKKVLNKTLWFYHRSIDLLDQQSKPPKEILRELAKAPVLPVQEEKANYLVASYFRNNEAAMVERLPDISIVMFIRNIPSVPTLVNHMGFVIKRDGKLYLNHAPLAKPWKIQEVLLEDYMKDMDAHRAPIEGLLFLELGKGA